MLADAIALVMLASLILYTLLGGADFGGGVWDLLATGPRAPAQRRLVHAAIAPVWEANHVWLILVVVLLFSTFPTAYSTACIALHIPLAVMLLGIVLRGSSFVFAHYGSASLREHWGRVFAVSSAGTPVMLGVVLAAITGGRVQLRDGLPVGGFVTPWLGLFPVAVGLFTASLCAFLAAVYLTTATDDAALQADFRVRALAAGVAVGAFALASALTAGPEASAWRGALLHSWWSEPLQLATGALALATFASLLWRRYRWARRCAVGQVTCIVGGWGVAQYPYLIAPDVTIANAAAPPQTLRLILWALAIGAPVLLPSLYWLLLIFKRASNG